MANRVYDDTMNHFRFSDFYTLENIADEFLKKHIVICEVSKRAEENDDIDPVYFWTDELDQRMKSHSDAIDNTKIKLYKNSDVPANRSKKYGLN